MCPLYLWRFVLGESMRNLVNVISTIVVLATPRSVAEPQVASVNRAVLTWSVFSCATYAELSGDAVEQKRLFEIGYRSAKAFVAAVENQTLPETERLNAPLGILMLLEGPSADFIVGRIFESAMRNAYDDVVTRDNSGAPLRDPLQWASGETKTMKAREKYQSANCALIR